MYQYNMTSDEQQKIKTRECRLYAIELRKQKGARKASKKDAEPILKNRCSIPNIDFIVMKKLCSMIEDDIFIFDEYLLSGNLIWFSLMRSKITIVSFTL